MQLQIAMVFAAVNMLLFAQRMHIMSPGEKGNRNLALSESTVYLQLPLDKSFHLLGTDGRAWVQGRGPAHNVICTQACTVVHNRYRAAPDPGITRVNEKQNKRGTQMEH